MPEQQPIPISLTCNAQLALEVTKAAKERKIRDGAIPQLSEGRMKRDQRKIIAHREITLKRFQNFLDEALLDPDNLISTVVPKLVSVYSQRNHSPRSMGMWLVIEAELESRNLSGIAEVLSVIAPE